MFAALSDGALARAMILALLAIGAVILAYSLVTDVRSRRRDRAITAFVLLCVTVVFPLLPIWTGQSPVWRFPHTLFEKGHDFE